VRPTRKRRALLLNSWVLLLAAGVLAITLVSVERLHATEPLEHAHAVTGAEPYLIEIPTSPVSYLYVVLTGAPWTGRGAGSVPHKRRRRRQLLSSGGDAWAAVAATAAGPARDLLSAIQPDTAAPPLEFTPGSPHGAAAHLAALRPPRRVLAASPDGGLAMPAGDAPKLYLALMQRNASDAAGGTVPVADLADAVVTPKQYGLVPVTQQRYCQMKHGAASRCLLSFTSKDIDAALYRPDRPMYLVFSLDQPGQVAFEVHANELGKLGPAKNWIALGILLLMLVGIASEKVHRM